MNCTRFTLCLIDFSIRIMLQFCELNLLIVTFRFYYILLFLNSFPIIKTAFYIANNYFDITLKLIYKKHWLTPMLSSLPFILIRFMRFIWSIWLIWFIWSLSLFSNLPLTLDLFFLHYAQVILLHFE